MRKRLSRAALLVIAAFITLPATVRAQTNFSVYSDELDNNFQDWGWGAVSETCTSPIHSGTYSMSESGGAWTGISFYHPDFNPLPFTNLSFWINSGGNGGQVVQIYWQYNNTANSGLTYQLSPLPATTNWQQYFIPFSALGVAGVTNLDRLNFVLTGNGTTFPIYLDDVNLTAVQPSTVHLQIDASQTLRLADSRWFGLNTAIWDSSLDTTTTDYALAEAGTRILRFPGGSLSDTYHWTTNSSWDAEHQKWVKWGVSFTNFIHVATNIGAETMITVNYGMGTTNEAAAWVRHADVTNHLGFKYWEIGNECYGGWEIDSNQLPHDPYTYAVRAQGYLTQMRAAWSNIEVGVVATPGENSYSNNATHFAVNPRTGTTNYGWTPILLSTLSSLGARPDFLIHHVYPEYGVDRDQSLLLASGNWAGDAANLRQQISDYFGSSGTNIELICTENNSDSGNQGRQSTSIVNGLYLADSLAQLMKTEINGFIWWDLRNGTDTNGDFDASLYGWRTYGDLGVINGPNTRHPTYYALKLMQYFAQPGDSILCPTSDYGLLTTYATRKADGALAVLVINKDRYATFPAQLALEHFQPWTNALVRTFGITQDEATRTNSIIPGSQDIGTNYIAVTGTNFTATFPPYSMTLLVISPAAPTLAIQSPASQLTVQVQGQPNVRYILETSANLKTWIPIATNTLSGTIWNFTNAISGPVNFWRAVWLP